MNITYKDAVVRAYEYNKHLIASDPRFQQLVIVQGRADACFLTFPNSFVLRYGDFFLIFTEHYGYHVRHVDDSRVVQYEGRKPIGKMPSEFDELVSEIHSEES